MIKNLLEYDLREEQSKLIDTEDGQKAIDRMEKAETGNLDLIILDVNRKWSSSEITLF